MANYVNTKDLAVKTRKNLKKLFPKCKFSVTSSYNSISVHLMSADFNPFVEVNEFENSIVSLPDNLYKENLISRFKRIIDNKLNLCLNSYDCNSEKLLSKKAVKIMSKVLSLISEGYWDDSDIMTDYFSTSHYRYIEIGKWDKPFELKQG